MVKIKWCLFLFLFPLLIYSQDKIIKGKVVDNFGLGIPGVTVMLKDSNNATTTDIDGAYSIATGKIKNGVLVFSYLGYTSKNMIFNNYLYFVINYCIENDSNNCIKIISDFLKEHGLCKNLHKKNVVKYIKWKN